MNAETEDLERISRTIKNFQNEPEIDLYAGTSSITDATEGTKMKDEGDYFTINRDSSQTLEISKVGRRVPGQGLGMPEFVDTNNRS